MSWRGQTEGLERYPTPSVIPSSVWYFTRSKNTVVLMLAFEQRTGETLTFTQTREILMSECEFTRKAYMRGEDCPINCTCT